MKDYDHGVLKVGDVVKWDPEMTKDTPGGLKNVPDWVLGSDGVVVGKGEFSGDYFFEFKRGDEVFKKSFAQNWFLEPVRTKKLASSRAYEAAEKASQWHQGSGIHADGCASIAEHFEVSHPKVAELFVEAAVAEAAHLEEVGGEWGSVAAWKRSKSGKATAKAVKAAKKVDPKFKLSQWM